MGEAYSFPMTRRCPFGSGDLPGPPAEHEELRNAEPAAQVSLFDGRAATFVARYADVKAVLRSPNVSSNRTHPEFPRWRPTPPLMKDASTSLVAMDDPDHHIYRRVVAPEFTVKQIDAMRPRIQMIADEAVDNLLAYEKPADFVSTVALAIPSLTICDLLGVPYHDHEFFQAETERMHRTNDPDAARAGLEALYAYIEDLVSASSSKSPEDGLISRLYKHVRSGELSEAQLAGLAFLMLVAGHETTSNMLALSTLTLMQDRESRLVTREPAALRTAIEELLRYFTITDRVIGRLAVDNVEAGESTYHAGDRLIVSTMAANFDESAFTNPYAIDLTRSPCNHLTFGFGKHSCVGQNLARAELEIGLETVFRRIPDLSLAEPIEQLPFKYDDINFGVARMPVTW